MKTTNYRILHIHVRCLYMVKQTRRQKSTEQNHTATTNIYLNHFWSTTLVLSRSSGMLRPDSLRELCFSPKLQPKWLTTANQLGTSNLELHAVQCTSHIQSCTCTYTHMYVKLHKKTSLLTTRCCWHMIKVRVFVCFQPEMALGFTPVLRLVLSVFHTPRGAGVIKVCIRGAHNSLAPFVLERKCMNTRVTLKKLH